MADLESSDCTYDQPSNRRRNPAPQYIEALEHRLQKAETILRSVLPGLDLDDPKFDARTVEQLIDEASASLKEKLELGRFARFEGGYVASYLHRSDAALPPTLGVLIQLDKDNAEVARDLAQQVAAMRPLYTTRDEVPADVVEKERRIAEQITRDEGKPEQAIGKIVDGRLNAYFKDVVLTEQPFVKDQKTAIKQVLASNGVAVTGFARFQVGQA